VHFIIHFVEPIITRCSESIYSPSDDTFLIIDYFKDKIDEIFFDGIFLDDLNTILDLGTGTGIIAIFLQLIKSKLSNFNPKIYASDILEDAINCAKKNEKINQIDNKIIFIQSNLFDSFPKSLERCFDIIIFNPPYLPSLEFENEIKIRDKNQISWDGGKKGFELFAQFLNVVKKFLNIKKKSHIYYVSSDKADLKELKKIISNEGFINVTLDKKHIFFENIYLNRLELLEIL
jgi:release factor glutamine methyltransferase